MPQFKRDDLEWFGDYAKRYRVKNMYIHDGGVQLEFFEPLEQSEELELPVGDDDNHVQPAFRSSGFQPRSSKEC